MKKKRIIYMGYSVPHITDICDAGFSYIELAPADDVSWNKKIENLKRRIKRNEILLVIILSEKLIDLTDNLQHYETFLNLIAVTTQVKSIVIIKDIFLNENFTVYDFQDKKNIGLSQIRSKITQLENQIAYEKKLNSEKLQKYENQSLKIEATTEFLQDIDMLKYEIEDIKRTEKYLEGWLRTYEEQEAKLVKINYQKDLIKKVISDLDKLDALQMSYDFGKNIPSILKDEILEITKTDIFNFYIPHNNLYSEQFGDFVQIFEKYLRAVEGANISLQIKRTETGTLYIIKSNNDDFSEQKFSESLNRFNEFIELCNYSPDVALNILKSNFPDAENALAIIQGLSKKYKRMLLDLQQEKERIKLSIKQDIQSEFLELNIINTPIAVLESNMGIVKLPEVDNYNILDGIKWSNYSEEEQNILQVVKQYGETRELINIKSNIDKLKDPEINADEKKSSAHKIKKFLLNIGKKGSKHAEDIAVKVITAYLENQVKVP